MPKLVTAGPFVAPGEVLPAGPGLGDLAGPASGVAAGVVAPLGPAGLPGPLELPEEASEEALEVPAELLAVAELAAFGVVPAQFGRGEAAGLLLGDALTVEPGL